MTFEVAPDRLVFPAIDVSAAEDVSAKATIVRASLRSSFLEDYNPGAYTASLEDALRAATLTLDNAQSFASMTVAQAASFRDRLSDFSDSVGSLISSPGELFDSMIDIYGDIVDSASAIAGYAFDEGDRPSDATAEREIERANFDAITSMVRVASIVRAAELAADDDYRSTQDSVAKRDEIFALIDAQLGSVDDEVYSDLQSLAKSLYDALPSDSPTLEQYTPPALTNSIVLSHKLYGDVSRESEIVETNSISHPGFIRGGEEIEVFDE